MSSERLEEGITLFYDDGILWKGAVLHKGRYYFDDIGNESFMDELEFMDEWSGLNAN